MVSSLLMNVVPATVAEVEEIAMCMGPQRNRKINPHMLVTAAECGVQKSINAAARRLSPLWLTAPKPWHLLTKSSAPGNLYVQLAKKEVYGHVDIDKLAGPSEILVIADSTADPDYVAADLISQAEHKSDSSAILVTPSLGFAEQVKAAIEIQAQSLPRQEEIVQAFENYGAAFIVADLAEAVALTNVIAPEHVELHVENPLDWFGEIRNAGCDSPRCIFAGSGGRLHRRSEPHSADRDSGALCLAAQR